MGRGKAKMELIKKEKHRNNVFQKRNESLKKKVYELTTLCDINAVLIIYGPKKATLQAHPLEPEIWPQNRDEVLELINKYKGQLPEDSKKRTTLLSDFFREKNKKAQQALTKLHNTNVQSKYPIWDPRFSSLNEEDFRKIVVFLENAIGNAKAKLEQMKANKICRAYHAQKQQQQIMLSKKMRMDSGAGNQDIKYLKIDPHQEISDPMRVPILMPFPIHQQRFPLIDHNRNHMMVKFGNEYAGGPSNNVHNAPLSKNVYPTMGGTLASIGYVNNLARAPPNYYGEGRQLIAQRVMEYRPMTKGSNSHQMVAASLQYYEDRTWQR